MRTGGVGVALLAPVLALALAAAAPAAAQQGSAPLRVTVDGRAVVVTGPSGYCVDRAGSAEGPAGAFVLLGSCAALGGGRARPEGTPAVLTASVTPGGSGAGLDATQFPALARHFASEAGRAALSRSGDADSVTLAEALSVGDVLYLRLVDRSAGGAQRVEPEYWRAILVLRGRMVTLSVLSHADRPLPPGAARPLLEAFVARMRAANPIRAAN
ncbi:cation transport ATPase [Frigidibacter oleivorans]|uniref:cation transport ATPase n=1 Tax=Frigidibacter oleivorans TaxID=2487129 RepID=UPI000F8ECB49|nr:cation transport ATPase [Frigidibacter oleivorans]